MILSDFLILADENIKYSLVKLFRDEGFNVKSISEENLSGSSDFSILQLAIKEKRVILTQDDDFAKIALTNKIYFTGIIHLRPGHLAGNAHILTLTEVLNYNPELESPFIISATNTGTSVKIKVRHFPNLK